MMNSEKSNTEERDKEKILDEVTMIDRNKSNDGDDNVNMMLFKEEMKQNQKKKIRQKLEKQMLQHHIYQTTEKNLKKTMRKQLTKKQQLQKMMTMI